MNNREIEECLQWRYATKKFDSTKKISEADFKTLQDSLVLTPTSYGLQMMKFLIVQNPEMREKLKANSWNQSQVTDCSHFVVFTARENISENDINRLINRTVQVRQMPHESLQGFKDMMLNNLVKKEHPDALNWNKKQTYIAMGFLLETAAMLKIDSVPMEGLDPAAYDKILGLEGTGWKTCMAVALGYRSADDKYQHLKKVRFPESELIQFI
jgi:nitroreductase